VIQAVGAATTRYYQTCGGLDPFDIIGLPDFVPRLTRRGIGRALRTYDEALSAAIAERRRNLAADPTAPRDMLGTMLAAEDPETRQRLTETEVKDNVMTLIFGGQETTSSAMTWAIYLLSQSPEWSERVVEEAETMVGDTAEAVEALVQTRAVVEEALRLYPPVIGITRTALQRTELAGRTIECGTMIIISPYVVHRHRRLWRDPDLFDPTRFLAGAIEVNRTIHVSSLRRRSARMRWRCSRHAGSHSRRGHAYEAFRARAGARSIRLAGYRFHHETA
jgi:cytochrome P450